MAKYYDRYGYSPEEVEQRESDRNSREGAGSFTQPVGSVPIEVIGSGGKVRHAGSFRVDNPYAAQIATATSNQDRDALYERAIEWEADRSNYEFQLEQNRDILQEQRQYDSPAEVAARMRQAGYTGNSTTAGSAGGSSSAQQQPLAMADQSGQTKFSNSYDNTSLAFEGINTVSNFITSFTGAISTLNSFHESLATFSDRKTYQHNQARMSEVSASIAEETKEDAVSVAKTTGRLHTAQLANDYIDQLGEIATLIPRDTKDEDIPSFLTDIGYDQDTAIKLAKGIQRIRQSDAMQNYYNENELAKEDSEAKLPVYTSERLQPLHEFLIQARIDEATSSAIIADFNKKFAELFYTDTNAQSAANIETSKLAVSAQQTELLRKNLISLANQIDKRNISRAKFVDKLSKRRDAIEAEGKKLNWRGRAKGLNANQIAEIESIDTRISYVESLANEELGQIYSAMSSYFAQQYLLDTSMEEGVYTPVDKWMRNPYATLLFTEYQRDDSSNPISQIIQLLLSKGIK